MLKIENPEADELARTLAAKTGRSVADVVTDALRAQLRQEGASPEIRLVDELMKIGRHCAALPDLDSRSENEILGYNDRGVW